MKNQDVAFQNSCAAVVVAAGKSSRMGGGMNKVLYQLCGRPVLSYCLEILQNSSLVSSVAVVGRPEDEQTFTEIFNDYCPKAKGNFVAGGRERFESVRNGLEHFANRNADYVLIQDAARPFFEERFIQDGLASLQSVPGCVIGVPLKDTLKEIKEDNVICHTPDRNQYWLAQTPQLFHYQTILEAYRNCPVPPYPTDDGAVLEREGLPVKMVLGSYHNVKITTPEDIVLAESLLSWKTNTSI